jgi:5-hydroxyisourate hydrolase
MSSISSHVLDTSLGRPAANLRARLDVLDGSIGGALEGSGGGAPRWTNVAEALTDDDGRIRRFVPEGSLRPGTYRVTFETKAYLEAAGRPAFYPQVDVVFVIDGGVDGHYHIPLLLSPFGYSTYRGS